MSLLDSSLLCEFLTECKLPETVEIVEGYDSNESAEMSWSSGETVYLHAMKDVPQVLALDRKGNRFCIPLNYPEKIFEGIPNRCNDRYENVGELIVDFPKYVRSLQSIPQSGVKVGDILCLLETSSKDAGCVDLKCKVVGNACPITLSGDQVGRFEALEDIKPITMREITDKHLLPTRVRVRAGARRFNQTNLNKVMLEGLFTIQEIAQEKVVIVYTLYGKDLRVLKVPIDLEIRVRRKTSKLDPKVFTEISRRIDEEVNIDSTITTSSREASWVFDISDSEQHIEPAQPDCFYEEIVPRLPPRSPSQKRTGPTSNQYTKLSKPTDNETRYVPPSELKPRRKTESLTVVKENGRPGPPPVAKKPSIDKWNSCHSQSITASDCPAKTTSRNEVQSHTERKKAEVQSSHCNRAEKAGDNIGRSGGTQSVSPVTPNAAKKNQATAFPKGNKKLVSPTLCKQTSNGNTQTPPKEESSNSHHPVPPMHHSIVSEKCRKSEENPTKLTSKNIKSHTVTKMPEVNNNFSRLSLAQADREFIGDTQDVSPGKAKPTRRPVDPVAARESVKAPSLPFGKATPDVTKLKPVEKEKSLSSLHTGPPLENPNSRFKKSDSKETATKLTSHNVESHKRTVKLGGDAGMAQGQTAKELLEGISVSEVCTWLTRLGLAEHVDRFEDESIDGDLLLELDAEMMLHLGILNPLHRKKLEMFIRTGWTPKKN